MKALFAALLVVAAVPAYAKSGDRLPINPQLVTQFPASINCKSSAQSSAVKDFTIDQLNTVRPHATIPDQGPLDDMVVIEDRYSKVTRIDMGFSNECDNSYGVQFFAEDLIALNAGSVTEIYGYLEYGDVELDETTNGLVREERLVMNCKR